MSDRTLTDDELDSVSGGRVGGNPTDYIHYYCNDCQQEFGIPSVIREVRCITCQGKNVQPIYDDLIGN